MNKVAFDIVTLDRAMATAAQLGQGLVVLVAVGCGYFTSMNQELVGAMAGARAARGRHTVNRSSVVASCAAGSSGPGPDCS